MIKRLLFVSILLLGMSISASAQWNIVSRTAEAQDGVIHVFSASGSPQNYDVVFPSGSRCSGTLAAYGSASCAVQDGDWAWTSDNVFSYILYTGNYFFAEPLTYLNGFTAYSGVAFSIANPNSATMTTYFTVFDAAFNVVAETALATDPYEVNAMFVQELFPHLPLYASGQSDYFVLVQSTHWNALMAAVCSGGTCSQTQ